MIALLMQANEGTHTRALARIQIGELGVESERERTIADRLRGTWPIDRGIPQLMHLLSLPLPHSDKLFNELSPASCNFPRIFCETHDGSLSLSLESCFYVTLYIYTSEIDYSTLCGTICIIRRVIYLLLFHFALARENYGIKRIQVV